MSESESIDQNGQASENKDFKVVVNHEEQYSVMPVGEDIPPGWREAGMKGTEAECEAYVRKMSARAPGPKPGS